MSDAKPIFTGVLTDEPASNYHAKREYISSSPLPEMSKSAQHFLEKWTAPDHITTDAMDRGGFIHSLMLEQDIEKYVARPLTDKGTLLPVNNKDYIAWLAGQAGKTPIHPDLYNEAMEILNAACANKTFLKAFEASEKEVSYYGVHEATGLPIKARPDMIAKDLSFILDVKSTADISKFEKQIFNLGYDVRLIHYVETIKAVTGKDIPEIYFLAIESGRPYGTKMFRLSADAVVAATAQWNLWMNEISACRQDNVWPGYSDAIVDVDRPKYLDVETSVSFDGVG